MTSTIAFVGKSGSGKTTLARNFTKILKENFKNSSILLVDCDLSLELSESFSIKTKNTIYGVKSGKHEYKTGVPKGMTKQEFIEWALEDIILQVDENIDLIASWLVTPKDCNCLTTKLTRDAMVKLVERYDFTIFDSEYDLKYLNSLVDYPIDTTLIVASADKKSIELAAKIEETSRKYALNGQMGIILNKVKKNDNDALNLLNALNLNLLGTINKAEENELEREIISSLEAIYPRLNLPQKEQ